MAVTKNSSSESAVAPAIRTVQDTRGDYYTGTKKALIAAGICKANWFPRALEPDFRKDGRPARGNNGKQRMRRTYVVEGRSPETSLHHKVDAYGNELWTVCVEITAKEKARREEVQQSERHESQRKREEWLKQLERERSQRKQTTQPAIPGDDAPITSRAVFERKDRAVYYAPDYESHLERVKIVEGYGCHRVTREDGEDEMLWGYIVNIGDKRIFVPAHCLRDRPDKPAHLKLVRPTETLEEEEEEPCPHCGRV